MAWLDEHPPARQQFRFPRREPPSGIVVVHTAESTPDTVATDGGAEAVANFIRGRSDAGSYHDLCDSDSTIQLVRYDAEAFHDATGSNRHSYGVSVATRADWWPLAPKAWRDGAVRQAAHAAARYARWVHTTRGITIPARRINRAQSEARMPGFISHAERDPARRTDPGAGFPWDQFLTEYARAMGEEDDMTEDDWKRLSNLVDARVKLAFDEWRDDYAASTAQATHDSLNAALSPKTGSGSVVRKALLEMGTRGVNESLGAEPGDDTRGLLAGHLAALTAKVDALSVPPVEPTG